MKTRLLRFLGIEPDEVERVLLLFIMGFSMGMFMATMSVASQSLFLQYFNETTELPVAFVVSGFFGLLATVAYNFLQNRIPFPLLAIVSLVTVAGITAFIEFGEGFFAGKAFSAIQRTCTRSDLPKFCRSPSLSISCSGVRSVDCSI